MGQVVSEELSGKDYTVINAPFVSGHIPSMAIQPESRGTKLRSGRELQQMDTPKDPERTAADVNESGI